MKAINELYCGKGTDPANSGSDTAVASYNGCVRAAEQVPMKAGLFALGTFELGVVASRLIKGGKGSKLAGLPKRRRARK